LLNIDQGIRELCALLKPMQGQHLTNY